MSISLLVLELLQFVFISDFCIERESLFSRNKWNSEKKKKKNYLNVRGFSVPSIKNFCKKMVYLQEFLKTMSMKWLE